MAGVRGEKVAPKPYGREKSFCTLQWMPGENVRWPRIPPLSGILVVASADQELDSKAISENA